MLLQVQQEKLVMLQNFMLYGQLNTKIKNKKDGYRQQNVRQRQKFCLLYTSPSPRD